MFPTAAFVLKATLCFPTRLMGACAVSGEAGAGGGAPTMQAAPPHTRQDAEADFLGGLIGGGEALSHSQKAMEFCRLRQPSTCRGVGHNPRPEQRTHEQEKTETKRRNGEKNTEGSMQMKKRADETTSRRKCKNNKFC